MKKIVLSAIVIVAASLAAMSFQIPDSAGTAPQDKTQSIFPEDIQKIMETSCYDCHTDAASNAKAKLKLNFSKWNELSDAKKVGKLEGIAEEIREGKMPPERYLSNNPGAALTAEQKELVTKWVSETSAKLMGQ